VGYNAGGRGGGPVIAFLSVGGSFEKKKGGCFASKGFFKNTLLNRRKRGREDRESAAHGSW